MSPWKTAGSPCGQLKATRVQNHRPVPPTQTMTGWLSVTATGTAYDLPLAQSGVQSTIRSVPVPVAWTEFHACQVMPDSAVVLSPDSTQSGRQPGSCSAVPVTNPLSARYTSRAAPVAGAALVGAARAELGAATDCDPAAEAVADGDGDITGGGDAEEDGDAAPPGPPAAPPQPAASATRATATTGTDKSRRVNTVMGHQP